MKKRVIMKAVAVFVIMLGVIHGSCEAKNILRRVQQFKDKALREVEKSGKVIQKFLGKKQGKEGETNLKRSVDARINKKNGDDEQTTVEQRLEILLHERNTLRW